MKRATIFSPDRKYRYTLWREWNIYNSTYAMFIGLNPSTADEIEDDPTIRRCIGFAKAWGYGALCMTNAFAFRATDPAVMKSDPLPIGPDNNKWLRRLSKDAGIIIAAWGVHGSFLDRDKAILKLLPELDCLGVTKDGHPKHPLYLPKTAKPQAFHG